MAVALEESRTSLAALEDAVLLFLYPLLTRWCVQRVALHASAASLLQPLYSLLRAFLVCLCIYPQASIVACPGLRSVRLGILYLSLEGLRKQRLSPLLLLNFYCLLRGSLSQRFLFYTLVLQLYGFLMLCFMLLLSAASSGPRCSILLSLSHGLRLFCASVHRLSQCIPQ